MEKKTAQFAQAPKNMHLCTSCGRVTAPTQIPRFKKQPET